MNHNYQITVGWLYPDLMSTYGDRGNILFLKKRCEWRSINLTVIPINDTFDRSDWKKINFIFGGGAQDREQEIVMRDMRSKSKHIYELIHNDIPALFVCGSPQLMGISYEPGIGKKIDGLNIFNMTSSHPGLNSKRCIGNTIGKVHWGNLKSPLRYVNSEVKTENSYIIGFENHGGRSYLSQDALPFAQVLYGYGNNGDDGGEGVVYKNAIGCYYHGPFLPKNPHIADFLIERIIQVKYNEQIILKSIDDSDILKARKIILDRYANHFQKRNNDR